MRSLHTRPTATCYCRGFRLKIIKQIRNGIVVFLVMSTKFYILLWPCVFVYVYQAFFRQKFLGVCHSLICLFWCCWCCCIAVWNSPLYNACWSWKDLFSFQRAEKWPLTCHIYLVRLPDGWQCQTMKREAEEWSHYNEDTTCNMSPLLLLYQYRQQTAYCNTFSFVTGCEFSPVSGKECKIAEIVVSFHVVVDTCCFVSNG